MKISKIILSGLFIILSTISIYGQIAKGTVFLSGATILDISSIDTEVTSGSNSQNLGKTVNIEIAPRIGGFAADNFLIGVGLPVSYSKTENDNSSESTTTTSFALAPFLRYYIGKDESVKPYFHGSFGIGNLTVESSNSFFGSTRKDKSDYKLSLYEIGGGLAVFLAENITLDLGLSYGSAISKYSEANNDSKITASGVSFGIGVSVFLSK